eukprot:scaffold249363_cov122-Cyclotella_meneghiniana.AAC.1
MSGGTNEAINSGATASQSSTQSSQNSNLAIDADLKTFSQTASGDSQPWWIVILDSTYFVDLVMIHNYYCGGKIEDDADNGNCLARLSNATISLLRDDDSIITSRTLGDTTGEDFISLLFQENAGCTTGSPTNSPTSVPSAEPSSAPSEEPSSVPSNQPSVIPSVMPSASPSSAPSDRPS